MAKEGGAGRARGTVRAGEYGVRAHSDIRTRPGGVFAGAQNGILFFCRRLSVFVLRSGGHASRPCPSAVASTALPYPPARTAPRARPAPPSFAIW